METACRKKQEQTRVCSAEEIGSYIAAVCSERERHTKDIYAAEAAPWQEHVRFHFPILLFLLLREEDIRKRKISLHIDDRH